MDLDNLKDDAKDLLDKRGGVEGLKEDAEELREIAGSKESLTDKAKDAVEALKVPGNPEVSHGDDAPEPPAAG